MLNNEAQAATATLLLTASSKANTAASTSAWVAVDGEGDIMFTAVTGAITGSIVYTINTATDGSGTGSAALTPNEGAFATVTADSVQKRTINASACKGYVQLVGTIVTGPVLNAASIAYRGKTV